jgi:hypothetical protein
MEPPMSRWQDVLVDGFGPIDRVAAVFQVGPPLVRLPFSSFKVKVIERTDGSFLATPNVAVLGADGHPSWSAGLGDSIEEALVDALRQFARDFEDRADLTEAEFAWADPTEF